MGMDVCCNNFCEKSKFLIYKVEVLKKHVEKESFGRGFTYFQLIGLIPFQMAFLWFVNGGY